MNCHIFIVRDWISQGSSEEANVPPLPSDLGEKMCKNVQFYKFSLGIDSYLSWKRYTVHNEEIVLTTAEENKFR